MTDNEMKYGKTYSVRVMREDSFIGEARIKRIGAKHVETNVHVLDMKLLPEVLDACQSAMRGWRFFEVKPRMGELIQRSIWELIDKEKENDTAPEDYDIPF